MCLNLYKPSPHPQSMEQLSSTKVVPGTKKVRDHYCNRLKVQPKITVCGWKLQWHCNCKNKMLIYALISKELYIISYLILACSMQPGCPSVVQDQLVASVS